jgi:glycogen(starch) synthase
MRVLMFGWEFPPHISGGLGTACYGLTKGLANHGVDVTFVIPRAGGKMGRCHVNLIAADSAKGLKVKHIDAMLVPYITSGAYNKEYKKSLNISGNKNSSKVYGSNLFQEVYRYSEKARHIAADTDFDVIHCHDWMTYPAGIKVKKDTNAPLVLHIHATEFDRTGDNPNQYVYEIERAGFHEADRIIAVSNFTKQRVVNHYGVPPEKVEVVHNAVEFTRGVPEEDFGIRKKDKVVLFLGRITLQKGPEYFLYAAQKVLEVMDNVKFVVAGSGDMEAFMIDKCVEMGLSDKFIFTGFLKGRDIDRAYRMADVYVLPSVSEPFGITPLEAMRNGTPVIISKQSGVSEVISHCLKVDFWDIHQLANMIAGVLQYGELHHCLKEHGIMEVTKFNWNEPAGKCIDVYNTVRGVS